MFSPTNFAYPFRYIQYHTKQIGSYEVVEHQLTFTSRFNHQYIVIVEEYPYYVFVIKFYLKAHNNSGSLTIFVEALFK